MIHVEWVDPDNIVIDNPSDKSAIKMITDIQKNKITKIRLLKSKKQYWFRYSIGYEICWYLLSYSDSRNGVYYTKVYLLKDDDRISDLNQQYRFYDREEKLNKLLK